MSSIRNQFLNLQVKEGKDEKLTPQQQAWRIEQLLAMECGWTQKVMSETDIPYALTIVTGIMRDKILKSWSEYQSSKKKGKR